MLGQQRQQPQFEGATEQVGRMKRAWASVITGFAIESGMRKRLKGGLV